MTENQNYILLTDLSTSETISFEKIEKKLNEKDDSNQILENDLSKTAEHTFDIVRKVHFPDDNKLVSQYFEPKSYWRDHKFCSSRELINSYKKACDNCNLKPIQILLEQLKGIDAKVCHERYEILNVSNTKLDLKQIECMEEIFKRVQFKTLNFENSSLDDESSASLFEIIEFYESCLKLNISMNSKLSFNGFNACCKMLRKTPGLETIELKGIMFTDVTMPGLCRALRLGSQLKVLHLENSNMCSKNLLSLSSSLKINIHLRELHLSNNRMTPSDGFHLGSLIKANKHIEFLDVRNNALADTGLSHICDGLCEQMVSKSNNGEHDNYGQGLLTLILWSNSVTHNGMVALSQALKVNKILQSLNLGNNPLTSEGIHVLRDGLLVNRSLLKLSLPCCRITCEGGVAIAEYLADTTQLMRLDLRDNEIKTAGLMAISLSMKVNKSLLRLDIDQVSKRDSNVKSFFETQIECLRFIQDRIQENKMIVMKNQEMELSQTVKNQDGENFDTNTSSLNNSLDRDFPDLLSSTSKNNEQIPVLLSDSIIENIDISLPNTCENPHKEYPVDMSLPLCEINDANADSVTNISNDSMKTLSNTTDVLEFDISGQQSDQVLVMSETNENLLICDPIPSVCNVEIICKQNNDILYSRKETDPKAKSSKNEECKQRDGHIIECIEVIVTGENDETEIMYLNDNLYSSQDIIDSVKKSILLSESRFEKDADSSDPSV